MRQPMRTGCTAFVQSDAILRAREAEVSGTVV
jgi:hypothetical protein